MGKATARRAVVRFGRPPKERAGEVEERILDAAHKLFLERGFEGASIDEIAEVARAGKPTIYARFANKRALFMAVVMRDVVSPIEQFETDTAIGATAEERLVTTGVAMLDWALSSERMGMMRLAVAEVPGAGGGPVQAPPRSRARKPDTTASKAGNCLACHAIDKRLMGPAYKDVATSE